MSIPIQSTSSNQYTATLLRKLLSPIVEDPTAADFSRLSTPMFEIALAVLSEGRDEGKRRVRLSAELQMRGLDPLLSEVETANPETDLTTLQTGGGWNAFDLADVITEDIPPINWILKPFIFRPSVTAWFGRPKSLKSLLILDMSLHIAGGFPWLSSNQSGRDGFVVMPVKVVWLDLENGQFTLKRRMKAIAHALGMEPAYRKLLAYSLPAPWPDLSKPENTAALITRLNELGEVGLLVIDHLSQVFGDIPENDSTASLIMGALRQIAESCELAVVCLHHAKKGGVKDGGALEDQMRGSGAILAGVDGAFLIERDTIDRKLLKVIPVATREADAPNISAQFSYTNDDNLDLIEARFWRIAWRKDSERAMDAILEALSDGKKNYTQLIAAAKAIEKISDKKLREAIATLESTGEIYYTKADKGAKIYQLVGDDDEGE